MSLRICTSEHMISDRDGLRFSRFWYPSIVAEAMIDSTKDGEIERAPDPVTTIDGDLAWYNNSPEPVTVMVQVNRGPRFILSTDPVEIVIHDAWSYRVGVDPQADFPSVVQDTFGGRLQTNRSSKAPDELAFGRYFLTADNTQAWVRVGTVPAYQSFHFRYIAAIQTPGVWVAPTEFDPRYEATIYYTRLTALAMPQGPI